MTFLLLVVFLAIGFGCFYWTKNIFASIISLFGILIVFGCILAVVTQGWGIVALIYYPHIWLPALIGGAVLGWIVRRNLGTGAKEKSQ